MAWVLEQVEKNMGEWHLSLRQTKQKHLFYILKG
jgi:hypothetical protein